MLLFGMALLQHRVVHPRRLYQHSIDSINTNNLNNAADCRRKTIIGIVNPRPLVFTVLFNHRQRQSSS